LAKDYDLVILGGGTGGYVAAIRASQLGLKTAIVEKAKLGGTCLHKGCIPSKALLKSAEVYRTVNNSEKFGILTSESSLDFGKVQERKKIIVEQLYKGVQHLMKKGKIDVYEGVGRILGPSIFSPLPGTISVEMNNGSENEMLIPKNVIIATGSRPKSMGMEVDGNLVMTSDEALTIDQLPKSILIIGGGVIGMEWASMLADFGVEVTVLEGQNQILPTMDKDISKEMQRLMKKKGVKILSGINILLDTLQKEKAVTISVEVKGETKELSAEKLLITVGRQANIEGIGLENTDIEIKNNFIQTNSFYQTKESHIYAIGDCIGGLQLAHVASHEGITAVEHIAGKQPQLLDDNKIPACIYSDPEIAKVGLTEEEAIAKGYSIKTGKFSFRAIGKALVNGDSDGFIKIISDEKTNDILGIHMIGAHVTELISEAGLASVLDATPWEIAHTIHPHPSLSEAMGEAALAVEGLSIHG